MDRNPENPMIRVDEIPSLSARRAWIEINDSLDSILAGVVALRKESVDRNLAQVVADLPQIVALRKESVDRNPSHSSCTCCLRRRSPQGERG